MKRLWKYIPPCLSDVQGFQAIINETDGAGIIDDPSRYKPIRNAGNSIDKGMIFAEVPRGFYHGNGWPGRNAGRIVQSDLRNEDIISGTEKKLKNAWSQSVKPMSPSFVLLCNAPSSAMISSDLETAADFIATDGNIPTGIAKIYGDKDYLFGMSMTLEAIGKAILRPQAKRKKSVNILGCNVIDWIDEAVSEFSEKLLEKGIMVLTKWGSKGMKKTELENASKAALNIVVNISGIRLAEYMKQEFDIPYIAGAPYGRDNLERMLSLIEQKIKCADSDGGSEINQIGDPEYNMIIIGEQFQANAIRDTLRNSGYNGKVLSFFEMEKGFMEPGDKKISGEDELKEITSDANIKLIIGDPDYRMAAGGSAEWINLPNSGMSVVTPVSAINMVGEKLNDWFKRSGI